MNGGECMDKDPFKEYIRQAEHEIADLFLNRWSPRSYADKPVADDVLNRLDHC